MDTNGDAGSAEIKIPATRLPAGTMDRMPSRVANAPQVAHPSGRESYGKSMQIIRGVALAIYLLTCCIAINVTQVIGSPLYFINRDWYYAYMAMTKRSFALMSTLTTQIWVPTTVRISGDASVAGQIRPTKEGGVEFDFPERMILIANHQIYTDWIYLWWIGYANRPGMAGHIYIILKESLRFIPILGWGMMFYGFIFMSRKMDKDRPRLAYRLNKLKQKRTDPNGKTYLNPMWLLLFPEGTNLSGNGRVKSRNWAKKTGLKDPEHVMLPRSTGFFFCLNELKGTIDYVYDCTVAYEGIPRGKYGEELFGLNSTYFQGRPPKSVNFYWRRFRVADIPLDDQETFDVWLREEWYKKDDLMEEYHNAGQFPAMAGSGVSHVETEVRLRQVWEIVQVFTVVGICGLIWNNVSRLLRVLTGR